MCECAHACDYAHVYAIYVSACAVSLWSLFILKFSSDIFAVVDCFDDQKHFCRCPYTWFNTCIHHSTRSSNTLNDNPPYMRPTLNDPPPPICGTCFSSFHMALQTWTWSTWRTSSWGLCGSRPRWSRNKWFKPYSHWILHIICRSSSYK